MKFVIQIISGGGGDKQEGRGYIMYIVPTYIIYIFNIPN